MTSWSEPWGSAMSFGLFRSWASATWRAWFWRLTEHLTFLVHAIMLFSNTIDLSSFPQTTLLAFSSTSSEWPYSPLNTDFYWQYWLAAWLQRLSFPRSRTLRGRQRQIEADAFDDLSFSPKPLRSEILRNFSPTLDLKFRFWNCYRSHWSSHKL